jgi:hypothetical protein
VLRLDSSTRKTLLVAVVLLAAIFLVTFREVRWLVLPGRLNNVLARVPRLPTARDILAIRPQVVDEARSLWLDPAKLDIEVRLEQHVSNGYALKEDMMECWWFAAVTVRSGARFATWETRVDNTIADDAKEELERGGIVIKPRPVKPS